MILISASLSLRMSKILPPHHPPAVRPFLLLYLYRSVSALYTERTPSPILRPGISYQQARASTSSSSRPNIQPTGDITGPNNVYPTIESKPITIETKELANMMVDTVHRAIT